MIKQRQVTTIDLSITNIKFKRHLLLKNIKDLSITNVNLKEPLNAFFLLFKICK
jgi:hypothetical protein